MKNPITRTGWFITPKSEAHLIELCKSMSNAAEAQRMMIFTMNYCHQLVDKMLNPEIVEITEEEIAQAIREITLELDVKELKKKLEHLEQLMRL